MASGTLLILIGEECKKQSDYHSHDKEYLFSILLGIESDTADVLGRLEAATSVPVITKEELQMICSSFIGTLSVPYPHFSAKTVAGKPLHQWTLEGRLNEITIPTRDSLIFELEVMGLDSISRNDVVRIAFEKVNSIPEVTDPRKALGNDFRRSDVRADWKHIQGDDSLPLTYAVADLRCVASSGTYMRTLATLIAKQANTIGLAFSIHRTIIGTYDETSTQWSKTF
jgi:tRNA pseudouridine(55) synthase